MQAVVFSNHTRLIRVRKTEIKANDHLTVGDSQHIKLGNGQFIHAGQEIHLSSGLKVVLEAGSELTLKGGGSFIKLDGGGVTLVGPVIKINSGGAPGSGSGAAPVLPGAAKPADADKAGMVTKNYRLQALAGHLLPALGCIFDASGKCMIHNHG